MNHFLGRRSFFYTCVCSWPSEMRTCFEEVLEDTDAVSLFFGFFKLDLSSLETPLPENIKG